MTETDAKPVYIEAEPAPRSVPSARRFMVVGVVIALIAAGFVGRVLLSGGLAGSVVADWLPWLAGTDVTLYYGDTSTGYLVPVSRTLEGDEESIDALAASLLAGPAADTGLVTVVPAGMSVRSVTLEGDVATIDLAGASLDDALAREAIVQSLASWPGVTEVRVMVGGSEIELRSGTHMLYFYDPSRDMLLAKPASATNARELLEEYLLGPGNPSLDGLPNDVEVLQFESAPGSGLIKLDLRYTDSLRTMAVSDGDGMRRILEGLIATLTTRSGTVDFVYLDFEGHATLGLGQCANLLRTVQPPPEVLNDERLVRAGDV